MPLGYYWNQRRLVAQGMPRVVHGHFLMGGSCFDSEAGGSADEVYRAYPVCLTQRSFAGALLVTPVKEELLKLLSER